MEAVLKKWGNSAAVRLPAPIVKEAQFKVNQCVEIRAEDGRIVISRRPKAARYKLSALLAEVRDDNLHGSIDFGPSRGGEAL